MVKGLPVSESEVDKELDGVADAAFVERVGQVGQVLEVMDAASGCLLPGGLTSEH